MISRFIVTATSELQKSALRELNSIASDLRKIRDFKNGVFLVETDSSTQDFIESLVRADPVFVKHIMPVQVEIGLTGQRTADLPTILEGSLRIADVSPGEEFSVQCRRIGNDYDYDAKDVEVFVGSHFESKGAIPVFSDVKVVANDPQKVISGYLFEGNGYIGFSTIRENLNEHCDEYRVFSRHPRSISRAEFKLMEALRKFKLRVPQGRALDLGAAPGGWTKVLVDSGMDVVAVDPAELDKKVIELPCVTHIKSKAEDYTGDGAFDLLVNDMNVDPEISAAMMTQMASRLKPGAFAIMTVKLVIRNPIKLLGNIRPILESTYDILKLKNLFHNRLEVTMLLRRKDI